MKQSFTLFAAIVVLGGMAFASPLGFFAISPQGTFLRQSANDVCAEYNIPGCNMNPTLINLAMFGVNAGDTLTITDSGGLCITAGPSCTVFPASSTYLGAVFSSTNTFLGPSNQNRLPDQIAPGAGATLIGSDVYLRSLADNGDTTIPDAFYISATVVVPAGANYLVLGVLDSAYSDNSSGSLGVNIDLSPAAVPEPGTYALMLGGIGALWMMRRKSSSVVK